METVKWLTERVRDILSRLEQVEQHPALSIPPLEPITTPSAAESGEAKVEVLEIPAFFRRDEITKEPFAKELAAIYDEGFQLTLRHPDGLLSVWRAAIASTKGK